MYEVELTPEAVRHLDRLPSKVRDAALGALQGAISEAPYRAGKALGRELEGFFSARRGAYRVIYEVDEEVRRVIVHRVQHRSDAYRWR